MLFVNLVVIVASLWATAATSSAASNKMQCGGGHITAYSDSEVKSLVWLPLEYY